MKRLLSVAIMVLVSLVGMVAVSSAADPAIQSVITQLKNIQQSLDAVSDAVSALQPTTNPTTGAINALLETVYDLDTVYDWDIVYDLEKVYGRVPARAKMYYITKNTFDGSDAIKACDPRFHMASISEIQDPGNLQYVTRSTTAYNAPAYEGFGPPSDHIGWVRTGSFPLAGVPDYGDFRMSSYDQQSGTTVWFRTPIRSDSYIDRFPSDSTTGWQMAQLSFSLSVPVWCVEDPE